MHVNSRSSRRACRRFVRGLGFPPAARVRDLLPTVERISGRTIRVADAPPGSDDGVCGMWIRTADVDYVLVSPETSASHQDHIIAHELAHILRNHRSTTALPTPEPLTDRFTSGLSLDPAMVRMVLGRTNYEHGDEHEAELIASYLRRSIYRRRPDVNGSDRIARTLLRSGS